MPLPSPSPPPKKKTQIKASLLKVCGISVVMVGKTLIANQCFQCSSSNKLGFAKVPKYHYKS